MGDFFTKNLWEQEPDFAQENYNQGGENGDDEEENLFGAQHVIALIDCHPYMFQPVVVADSDIGCGFEWSLKVVLNLLQLTIEQTVKRKTGKRNRIGILLYNTKSVRNDDPKINGNISDRENPDKRDDDDDDKMDDEEEEINGLHDEEEYEQLPVSEMTVHQLMNLELPGVKQVLDLQKLLNEKGRNLRDEYCPAIEEDPDCPPLQTALEEATKMLNHATSKSKRKKNESDNKSVWIFTNQAAPYSDQKGRTVETIADDAKEERIHISVWPIICTTGVPPETHAGSEQFVSPFFESICTNTDGLDKRLKNYEEMNDKLYEEINDIKKNRRSHYGPLHILRPGIGRSIEEPPIMIDWYSLTQLLKRPGKVQIDNENNRETVKIREILEKDTGNVVAKLKTNYLDTEQRENQKKQPGLRRFRQFFNFAGELVPITQDDTQKVLKNSNGGFQPGLTILGFKPRNTIPFYHCVSTSYVIFPNETEVKGTTSAFLKLYRAMVRKNVVAICEVLYRKTLQSRLAALYPVIEDDDDDVKMPPSMHVLQLPFEDDIRTVAPDAASMELNRCLVEKKELQIKDAFEITGNEVHDDTLRGNIASRELVDAAIKLMEKLDLSESVLGQDFDNAALEDFYSYLNSVAFDMPKETASYDTRPRAENMRIQAGKEIDYFSSLLPADTVKPKTISKKRSRNIVSDDSGIDWKELYNGNEIDTIKVENLKKYLRSVGLPLSGRKEDLVKRVINSLEQLLQTTDSTVMDI